MWLKMKQLKKQFDRKEAVITILTACAALVVTCRIFLLLRAEDNLYTMGIFPLAIVVGLYCLWKKTLFLREVFFSVWVRIILAAVFTALQVVGMWWSNPGMESSVSGFEICLWIICLTPLAYAGQNALFAGAAGIFSPSKRCVSCREGDGDGADIWEHRQSRLDKWFRRFPWMQKEFSAGKGFRDAFAVIMLGFMIPFVTYYPAIMAYDVIPQLDQIKISGYTTHHPLVHTLMLSCCLKIGEILPFVHNADRAGLAVYSLLQMAVMAGAFAYVYVFLRKRHVNRYLCYFYVLCAAFYPTHGMLAISITKDSIYAVLVMLFVVWVYDAVTKRGEEKLSIGWLAAYTVITVMLLLFRNNSIYAWILFLLVYGAAMRKSCGYRKIMISHVLALILYLAVNMGLVSLTNATSATYAREMLSVPTQQIARAVAYHGEELTKEDYEKIAAVWGEDNLPEYVPAIADRSKRDISNDAEVLGNLADLWADLGRRYPGEYMKAFMLKNKGMWYLEDTSYLFDVYSYTKGYLQITYPSDQQEYIEALVPGYYRHQKLQILQAAYRFFAAGDAVWRYVPFLAVVMQPACYCYLLLYYILICIGLKRYRYLIPVIYLAALAGTLLLGPCVLVRYMYPIMLAVTVLILAESQPVSEIPERQFPNSYSLGRMKENR